MKLNAKSLRKLTEICRNEYQGMEPKEVVNRFMEHFKIYFNNELEENHCSDNPQKFLIFSAKIGMSYVNIFHGHVPKGYEDLLIPHIKEYLTKVFELQSFIDFGLQFLGYNKTFQTIQLTWYPSK